MVEQMVSICMITYNHEFYIEQAIRSVLNQKITFEAELIIANDCSTDNTRTIIESIENLNEKVTIKVFHQKTNLGMMKNFIFALGKCKSKYIALCEGDDYWTDPFKLQKQVDFLEDNSQYNYCGHQSWAERNGERKRIPLTIKSFDFSILIFQNLLNTSTLLFRRSSIQNIPDFFHEMPAGDWALQLLAIRNSKAFILADYMSVYREHEKGIWSNLNNKHKCERGITVIRKFKKVYKDKEAIGLIKKAEIERRKAFGLEKRTFKLRIKNFIKSIF